MRITQRKRPRRGAVALQVAIKEDALGVGIHRVVKAPDAGKLSTWDEISGSLLASLKTPNRVSLQNFLPTWLSLVGQNAQHLFLPFAGVLLGEKGKTNISRPTQHLTSKGRAKRSPTQTPRPRNGARGPPAWLFDVGVPSKG